ncbi:M48 family metallopeptidase [Psychrobacter sp. TAE2020]|uniref:M48 family metallopeptidase n=1 Tax=Psychrobacter sp. TAE2020 TaxID=2846762 RepID=UPI001C10851B|nr:YgjP-like metallopeptidase domain-containing protein [Psychrobacter sp. TAE2020]MBU5617552.1 M48 family metallopeptidase [Psychrobacter sp. TAE2020]
MTTASSESLLTALIERLAAADIELKVSQKKVRNINFRLKPYQLAVSVPVAISAKQVAQAIDKRVDWALDQHKQLLIRHQRQQQLSSMNPTVAHPILLWGKAQSLNLNEHEKLVYYRQQLAKVMPELFDKWQPIIKAKAKETRIKKMHTRWGSCNTRAHRIWLSVYLPAFPIECTEYVIVHELCHLHHANHSRAFWQTVETAMPEYKQWHTMLAGKAGKLD